MLASQPGGEHAEPLDARRERLELVSVGVLTKGDAFVCCCPTTSLPRTGSAGHSFEYRIVMLFTNMSAMREVSCYGTKQFNFYT